MNDLITYLISLESKGIKLGLKRTKTLLNKMGNPQKKIKCIQIAGTNGKGSVASMIAKGLTDMKYKVGLFTSPHLVKINERIRINGIPISNKELNIIIRKIKKYIKETEATFFEATTAIAMFYFKIKKTDIAILETGLGGRYDSVTTCNPILTAMTSISYDHGHILGNTLEKIAKEKAGIIKQNVPLFCTVQKQEVIEVIEKQAKRKSTKINYFKRKHMICPNYLKGEHQQYNAELAINCVSYISKRAINQKMIKSIKETKWYGRYQIIKKKPFILFDVAHNEESVLAFLKEYKKEKIRGKKYLIIALQKTKQLKKSIEKIKKTFDFIICTETQIRNYMKAKELTQTINSNQVRIVNNPEEAITNIRKKLKKEDSLVIIGSHYFGKHVKKEFKILFDKL